MEITYNDIKIMMSMALALMIISFVFPPLGFTGENVSQNEIPEFSIDQGTFEFTNIDPNDPDNAVTSPDSGVVQYKHNEQTNQDQRQVWLRRQTDSNGFTTSGYSIVLLPTNGTNNPEPELTLNEFNNTAGQALDQTYINEGQYAELNSDKYDIGFENVEIENENTSNLQITVDYEIERSADPSGESGGGWLERIPVIGGAAQDAVDSVSSVLSWIGTLFYNIAYNFMVMSTNLFVIIFNIVTFFIGFVTWLTGSYGAVITNAPHPAVGLLCSIPGILLSFEFVKFTIVIVRSLPLV